MEERIWMERVMRMLLSAALLSACGEKQPPEPAGEPWAGLPPDQWPTILLTSHIRLGAMEFRDKANAFLIDVAGDTLAATCKHLFLAFENPDIQSIHFSGKLDSWTLYPRGSRADSFAVARLLNADAGEKIVKQYVINRDWLVFSLREKSPRVHPLKPRFGRLEKGTRVYLVGWTEDDGQQVIAGSLYESYDYKYLADFGGRDVGPFSGAPVLDADGRLVGIQSGAIGEMSWVNSTKYLKEVLERRPSRDAP